MMKVGTVKNRAQWERYDVYNDLIHGSKLYKIEIIFINSDPRLNITLV